MLDSKTARRIRKLEAKVESLSDIVILHQKALSNVIGYLRDRRTIHTPTSDLGLEPSEVGSEGSSRPGDPLAPGQTSQDSGIHPTLEEEHEQELLKYRGVWLYGVDPEAPGV